MKEYSGGCHCGAIRFTFHSDESVQLWSCNCSICEMLDYEHLFIKHELFKVTTGEELINEYVFESESAKHLFCKKCGIKSFYQPRSHPDVYSINLKCVDDPPKVHEVFYFDGKNFDESMKKIR